MILATSIFSVFFFASLCKLREIKRKRNTYAID